MDSERLSIGLCAGASMLLAPKYFGSRLNQQQVDTTIVDAHLDWTQSDK